METYRINEIFYSLQGEGRWTGRAAVFIRFSGCNLRCPFCDTDFHSYSEYTSQQIIEEIRQYPSRFVVLTGGEPTLQVDDEIVAALHAEGLYIAMETNGTHMPPEGIDWITLSPKDAFVDGGEPVMREVDELKVVFDGKKAVNRYDSINAIYRFLQPCDVGVPDLNGRILAECIEYIKNEPEWQLSLQTHKITNIR